MKLNHSQPRSRSAHVLVGVIALTLGACAVGPDFKRPDAPTTTTYTPTQERVPATPEPEVTPQAVQLGTALPEKWWNLFKNDALDPLIQQALQNNQSIIAATASVEQSRALAEASTGARLPQIDLTAGAGRNKLGAQFLGDSFQLPPFTYFSFGTAVSYTLDYTGGVGRAIERQRALAEYQQYQLQAARLTVMGNVVSRAIELAAIQAEIHTVEELLNEDQRNVDMVKDAFEAGSVTRLDLLSSQNELASDATLLPSLRQRYSAARNALAILTGREPSEVLPGNFDLTAFELPLDLPVELPSELVHRRPDILAAEAQLHASTAAVGVATSNLYPRITLSGTLAQQAVHPSDLFDGNRDAWSLISGVTAPLFDGGRLRAERRAALAGLNADAARYRQTVLTSFAQVADALDAISHSADLLTAQSQALKVAQQNLELTRDSYHEGNIGVLQVLDSERSYQRARVGFVRAQAQRLQSTAQLFVAMGRSE